MGSVGIVTDVCEAAGRTAWLRAVSGRLEPERLACVKASLSTWFHLTGGARAGKCTKRRRSRSCSHGTFLIRMSTHFADLLPGQRCVGPSVPPPLI
jgi:hypothetical protein